MSEYNPRSLFGNCVPWTIRVLENDEQLPARFLESDIGYIPVRDWLLELSSEDRKAIGDDIRPACRLECRFVDLSKVIKNFGRSE